MTMEANEVDKLSTSETGPGMMKKSSMPNDFMETVSCTSSFLASEDDGLLAISSSKVELEKQNEDSEGRNLISAMNITSEGGGVEASLLDLEIQRMEIASLMGVGHSEVSEVVSAGNEETNNFPLPESSLLINKSAGFGPEDNLKRPFKGFTAREQDQYFAQLEVQSSNLFSKVQRLKEGFKNSVISLVKAKKGMIPIRKKFPKDTLFYKRFIPSPPPLQLGSSESISIHSKLLADESIYSKEILSKLKAPFEAGWKREIVMRSGSFKGRKTANVFYYSPSGVKFQSSKEVEIYLKSSKNSFTAENFTFSTVRISMEEVVREAFTGTPPALDFSHLEKAVPTSNLSGRSVLAPKRDLELGVEEPEDKKRRTRTNWLEFGMLPPKYSKNMLEEDRGSKSLMEIANDSPLFQISAINQSGVVDSEGFQRLLEQNQNQETEQAEGGDVTEGPIREELPKVENQLELFKNEGKHVVVAPHTLNRKFRLCSVLCEGRGGQMPTLHCVTCLCLVHAECVGLPDLVCCSNFMCPNCYDLNRKKGEMTPPKASSSPLPLSRKLSQVMSVPLGTGNNSSQRKMPVVPIPQAKSFIKPKTTIKIAPRFKPVVIEARNSGEVTISLENTPLLSSAAAVSSPFKIPVGRPPLAAKQTQRFKASSAGKEKAGNRTRSNGVKSYHCNKPCCGKAFWRQIDLLRHLLIHTGETPYRCFTCGMQFNRTSNLQRHLQEKHGLTKVEASLEVNIAAREFLKELRSERDIPEVVPDFKLHSTIIYEVLKIDADFKAWPYSQNENRNAV